MPRKSSTTGKAGVGNNGNLTPSTAGEIRNPQGINAFTKMGRYVLDRMDDLIPVQLTEGETTILKRGDALARQLIEGAMDHKCKGCSEKQHHLYLVELLKRYWPAPRDAAPVVPIQIIVQQGPQETFVKAVLADASGGQTEPDGILEALSDLPAGGNGKGG